MKTLGADSPFLDRNEDPSAAWLQVTRVRRAELVEERTRTLDLLRQHRDALVRTCRPGHLTGSALVIEPDSEQMLLLLHTKLNKWLQPGGHADGDGNLAAVALREATEETGIEGLRVVVPAVDIDIHEVDPPKEDAHLHFDLRFVVIAPPNSVVQGNHESQELRWVDLAELDRLAPDDGLRRLARCAIDLVRAR